MFMCGICFKYLYSDVGGVKQTYLNMLPFTNPEKIIVSMINNAKLICL